MIEKIEYGDTTFALILRYNHESEGVTFVTSPDNPLQLGILKHCEGHKIKPHIHRNISHTISGTQEILHIEYGKVKATFYEAEGKELGSTILNHGDTILLLSGAHGFEILKDTKIIEVKQGPYYGVEDDKTRLGV